MLGVWIRCPTRAAPRIRLIEWHLDVVACAPWLLGRMHAWLLILLVAPWSVLAASGANVSSVIDSASKVLQRHIRPRSLHKRSAYSGKATWYDVETSQQGACGKWINNDMPIVALNQPMYGPMNARSNWCGKTIMINNGLTTKRAVVMDACPETRQCHHGSLDMSMSLFQEFHGLTLGEFPITWWTVDGHHGGGGGGTARGSTLGLRERFAAATAR